MYPVMVGFIGDRGTINHIADPMLWSLAQGSWPTVLKDLVVQTMCGEFGYRMSHQPLVLLYSDHLHWMTEEVSIICIDCQFALGGYLREIKDAGG